MKKYPRNEPCPCGTGRKYKNCCNRKGFVWMIDKDGAVHRQVPLTAEAVELLKAHRVAWTEKYGREPGPDDLMFPDMPSDEVIAGEMADTMEKLGAPPALVHAVRKTGMIVTEDNQHLVPQRDLDEWHRAIDEWHEHNGEP